MDERRAQRVAAKAAWFAAQTPEKQAEIAARAALREELAPTYAYRKDQARDFVAKVRDGSLAGTDETPTELMRKGATNGSGV